MSYAATIDAMPSFANETPFLVFGRSILGVGAFGFTDMEIFDHLVQTRDEIREAWKENQDPSWDGYGAKPISEKAAESALEFVHLLHAEIAKPDVVPESDGAMGLEWRHKDKILVLSFLPNGSFTFAGHFPNNDKVHGSGKFEGEVPAVVETLLDEYFCED